MRKRKKNKSKNKGKCQSMKIPKDIIEFLDSKEKRKVTIIKEYSLK